MKPLRATLFAVLTLAVALAHAAYPDKPIKVVLGFAAGGGSDILLRAIAPALGDALGQPLIVENQPGAGGNLAMAAVAHAAPDGYTLLMGSPGLATNSSLYSHLGFDPLRDFAPVAMIGSVQNVLLVRPGLPVRSVAELIAYARQNPGKLNYASPGIGTSLHLAAELFKVSAGIQMVHVPYKGGGQALTDLMGGQVDVMFNVLPSALPQIKAGTVRALAVTGQQRAASLPDLPTMIEAGVPGYTAVTWNGIVAPAGTPKEIITKINEAVERVLRAPEMQKRLAEIGQDVLIGTPEQFGTLIRDETVKWKRTIAAAGLKAQ
ncbi:MAG: tripartite tricarboxylate transporter substrate binding protein [Caldimonas sp.]